MSDSLYKSFGNTYQLRLTFVVDNLITHSKLSTVDSKSFHGPKI